MFSPSSRRAIRREIIAGGISRQQWTWVCETISPRKWKTTARPCSTAGTYVTYLILQGQTSSITDVPVLLQRPDSLITDVLVIPAWTLAYNFVGRVCTIHELYDAYIGKLRSGY